MNSIDLNRTAYASYWLLRVLYGIILPLIGIDKFFNVLANWKIYLHPALDSLVFPEAFLYTAAIIEITAGVLILFGKVRLGGSLATMWLILTAINFGLAEFYDIALRDLAMAGGTAVLILLGPALPGTKSS